MRKPIFTFSLIALFFINLHSQKEWSLEECIIQAIDNNMDVENSEINLAINEIDLNTAIASRYPNFNGTSSLGWNFGKTIDPTTNTFITETFFSNSYGLNSAVTLYSGGRINKTIEQSELNKNASEQDLHQMHRFIAEQTALNYLAVVFAEENLELSKKQLLQSQQQLDQIDKFIDAELRPKNDRLEIEVQYLQSEQSVVVSQNNFEINMLRLKQLMRVDPNSPIKLVRPKELIIGTDPELITFEEAFETAVKNNPSIKAEEWRVQSSELGINLAQSALYPSLSAFGNLQTNYSNRGITLEGTEVVRQNQSAFVNGNEIVFGIDVEQPITSKAKYNDQLNDNLSYGFGFGLNVPIYNNRMNRANVQKAELASKSSFIGLEKAKDNLKVSVQQALIDAKAAKRKMASSKRSLDVQNLAFENAEKRFEIGAISSFELTSILTQLESAQITELIDRYDYTFKVKVLEFYMGKPIKL